MWDSDLWNKRMSEGEAPETDRPDHHVRCGTAPGSRCIRDCPCPCHLYPTDWTGIMADIATGVLE